MPSHEEKRCPRCQRAFECKSGSILLCQCQTVLLSPEQLEFIAGKYEDCLCSTCLLEARSEYNIQQYKKRIKRLLCE
ncbi:MAG: cysteine-rich CWC family protein [Gammaproteobacteria bacterium]|nr:cysteine-rich CWC family protein [Gammaproteobacteria bacterium]